MREETAVSAGYVGRIFLKYVFLLLKNLHASINGTD